MDILTSTTNSIIGFTLLFQLLLFAQWLTSLAEYKRLAAATDNLRGDINYSLDRTLRSFWSFLYQWQDDLFGVKPLNIKYFN
ncbi:hypothetical protein [Cyanobacterium aponinum]|uniref:hypothetical protein n=1 Tax=Cyanobacterium aponinum TaxID=379064 RepID=UPI0010542363|nr:hypothetical protein [Cyanobacterium aponinum]